MKAIANLLKRHKPLYAEGGKLRLFWPVYQAADNFFFSHIEEVKHAPYGRDPIDLKRYMSMVIVALLPALLASIYYFGPRILIMMLVSYMAGGLVEVGFSIVRKEEINEGFLVTGFIFPLVLPPGLPYWMVAVGMIFGVLVGKEVFGGTGRNLFNAALLGRCFLLLGYPAALSKSWVAPQPGAWLTWLKALPGVPADALTGATPLMLAKNGTLTPLWDLFVGQTSGSVGETSALAILIGGLVLVGTRVASLRTTLGCLLSFSILGALLHWAVPARVSPLPFNLLSGGFLFGAFFMATDPVTGPVTGTARWIYGAIIGSVTILIRSFSGYVEGAMFAILLGNIFAPLLDEIVIRFKIRSYAREN
jgi:Na(+)-translocating NADH:ubiquinone oxidoreductase B subunit